VYSLKENGRPSLYDYLAAAMITIATVWLWAQAAIHFPQFFEEAPPLLVTAASYAFYTLGGAAASYLVLNKSGSRQVTTGLKVGAFCSIASILYYYIYSSDQPSFIVLMFTSLLVGGYIGAIVRIKLDTRRIEAPLADVNAEPDENTSGS